MKKTLLLSIIFWLPNWLYAQPGQIGEWVDYSPYHSVFSVSEGDGKVYGATPVGLIEYTKSDNSVLRFSKVEGLSDIGLKCLGYNKQANTFVVGYSNGKIDLITETEIITVTDLFNKTLAGNKSLNSIYMLDEFAYIATGFGIIKFNVERQEFAETYFVEQNGDFVFVNDLTISNDTIYAATVNGVKKGWLNDPQLTFYKSWYTDSTLPFPNKEYNLISSFENDLYLNLKSTSTSTDTLYRKLSGESWNSVQELSGLKINSVEPYKNTILICHDDYVASYDSNWAETNRIFNYGHDEYIRPNTAIIGEENVIWVGDNAFGLIRNYKPFGYDIINPESPFNSDVAGISILNNEIWIAAGSRQTNWNNNYSNSGVYWRTSELNWGRTSKLNDTILKDVYDFVEVIQNPTNPELTYGASLGGGLVEFTGHKTSNIFDETNTILKEAIDFPTWVGITGVDFDKSGNLWMMNSRNPFPLAVYTNENKWYSYSFGSVFTADLTGPLIVGENNYKWGVFPSGGKGILLFDDGGTFEDLSDDRYRILNANVGSGGLPNNNIYCLAEDLDGRIWVGTAEGIGVFYSPDNMFTEGVNSDAQQIIVEVDGYFQYLLGTETVTAIAVDGANRKWFGTNGSGVFLMSADGTQQHHHFTQENSPLLSNFIKTIEINSSTGEVLFGTNNGIIAFIGSATGDENTTAKTYAYPNPVPQNYFGLIGIKGLPANSDVRITDVAGNLVFETTAEGTQAVWNGNDMNGNRVGTGIYLVFGIDKDGKDSQVAKILFTQ
jgi:hypothetical protein